MSRAFTQASIGGKQFDDVLKSLALRLSRHGADGWRFKPVRDGAAAGSAAFGGCSAAAVRNVARGEGRDQAVRGRRRDRHADLFSAAQGGIGLAGEAGPEAILPLARGPTAGSASPAGGGARGSITVNIATPDAESFRRSESLRHRPDRARGRARPAGM